MRVLSMDWAIARFPTLLSQALLSQALLISALLGQAAIAQDRPGSDRLISAPQINPGSLYRPNAQDFFLKGQERLETEVQRLNQPQRLRSEGVLQVSPEVHLPADPLPADRRPWCVKAETRTCGGPLP